MPMLSALALSGVLMTAPSIRVIDGFGRDITDRGMTLLDWEGQLANPAILLRLAVDGVDAPADVYVSGTSSRIHFDRASPEDRTGIGRRLRMEKSAEGKATPLEFWTTIFPDRDAEDERHRLLIQVFKDGKEMTRALLPVQVVDRDPKDASPGMPIHLDFTFDQTGTFQDDAMRRVVRQAADDWSFFLADTDLEPVQRGDEPIQLWEQDGFVTPRPASNPRSYQGFYLYVTGIRHDEMRAGGAPSLLGKLQRRAGKELGLRRSGSVEFDVRGNWNQLGWFVSQGEHDWWVSGNLRGEPNDLYSLALHEMGHALAFHTGYPAWERFGRSGLAEPEFVQYHGAEARIDASQHFIGVVDPISRYGSFGCEYQALMKARRWLLTKSHLVALKAVGYRLRPISALEPLRVEYAEPSLARVGSRLALQPLIVGGVPGYHFSVKSGVLPEGLSLDCFTGEISGRVTKPGRHRLTIQVRDSDPTAGTVEANVVVQVIA